MNKFRFFLSILIFCSNAISKPLISKDRFESIKFSFGTWNEFYNETQTKRSGALNNEFEFTPYISLSTNYKIRESHILVPSFSYVFQEKRQNETMKINRYIAGLSYGYIFKHKAVLSIGSSTIIQTISGDGNSQSLQNGDGSQTFYAPSDTRFSINQSLDIGAEILLNGYSLGVNTYTYDILDQKERMTTVAFNINFTKDIL